MRSKTRLPLFKDTLHTLAGRDQQWYDSERGSWRYVSCQALKTWSWTSLVWRQVASCDVLLTRSHCSAEATETTRGTTDQTTTVRRSLGCCGKLLVRRNLFWLFVRPHLFYLSVEFLYVFFCPSTTSLYSRRLCCTLHRAPFVPQDANTLTLGLQ